MKPMLVCLAGLCVLSAQAQTPVPRRLVRATGDAVISVKPDQAKLTVGVITRAATAQEAAAQNASKTDAVLVQLRSVLLSNGNVQTVNYSIGPNYQYPPNAPPVLIGYTANNSVEVTTSDLASVGRLIDTASQAGANSIGGLRFTLKDQEPLRAQALAQAAKQARAHAEAIASGLGARLGSIITAQESSAVSPLPVDRVSTGAATTPIETGLVQVQATVTVDVEIVS